MQISNGISRDGHPLFTSDAEIASCRRARARAGRTREVIFISRREGYARGELREIPPENTRAHPWLMLRSDPLPRRPGGTLPRKYSPIKDYGARRAVKFDCRWRALFSRRVLLLARGFREIKRVTLRALRSIKRIPGVLWAEKILTIQNDSREQ